MHSERHMQRAAGGHAGPLCRGARAGWACTCGGHALRPLPSCPLTCLWVSVRQATERVLGNGEKPQELKAQPGQTHNTLYPHRGVPRSVSSCPRDSATGKSQAPVLPTASAFHRGRTS